MERTRRDRNIREYSRIFESVCDSEFERKDDAASGARYLVVLVVLVARVLDDARKKLIDMNLIFK